MRTRGRRMAIKDNMSAAGVAITNGSKTLKASLRPGPVAFYGHKGGPRLFSKTVKLVAVGGGYALDSNTCPPDVAGEPACTVPAGLADGLPVGMTILSKKFDDAMVLRAAHAFETAVGGFPTPDLVRSYA